MYECQESESCNAAIKNLANGGCGPFCSMMSAPKHDSALHRAVNGGVNTQGAGKKEGNRDCWGCKLA